MKNVQRFILCYLAGIVIGTYVGYSQQDGTYSSCLVSITLSFILMTLYCVFLMWYYNRKRKE